MTSFDEVGFHESEIVDLSMDGDAITMKIDGAYIGDGDPIVFGTIRFTGVRTLLIDDVPSSTIGMAYEYGSIIVLKREGSKIALLADWDDFKNKLEMTKYYEFLCEAVECDLTPREPRPADLKDVRFRGATLHDLSMDGDTINLKFDDPSFEDEDRTVYGGARFTGVRNLLIDGAPSQTIRMEDRYGTIVSLTRNDRRVILVTRWKDSRIQSDATRSYEFVCDAAECWLT